MAVACPNERFSIGKRQTRAVYVNFALFYKTQDTRNTISCLLHAITLGRSSVADFAGKLRKLPRLSS
jgi:hypothetical protein